MKRPPNGSVFQMTQMRRVDFLDGALHRLQDDVGTILGLIGKHNHSAVQRNERVIGFWACLRMILPIIEAVAHVLNVRPQEILGNHLNISTPNLAWDLFRHSLTHGDYLQVGTYNGQTVTWGVAFIGQGHVITNDHIGIDLLSLYEDFVRFLQEEVDKNDQTMVDIETGVEYGAQGARSQVRQEIIDDFSRL